ncbi:MAG: FkbM family methyltransferase, partial [Candidatus Aenigmatarchaeota archaeon]
PNRETFEALKENVKINNCKNVVAYNIAATKSKRRVKLFIPKDEGRSSIVEKRAKYYQLVYGIPLHILLKKMDLKTIHWMKIDVEGAEIIVIEGMKTF